MILLESPKLRRKSYKILFEKLLSTRIFLCAFLTDHSLYLPTRLRVLILFDSFVDVLVYLDLIRIYIQNLKNVPSLAINKGKMFYIKISLRLLDIASAQIFLCCQNVHSLAINDDRRSI